jgi:hypothetical protein
MITEVRPVPDGVDVTAAEASLIGDWLGLADYLAVAVTSGDETVDAARAELAASATGLIERQALERAADIAAARLGDDALITTLLRWATTQAASPAEAA